jgi:hypothetical protein
MFTGLLDKFQQTNQLSSHIVRRFAIIPKSFWFDDAQTVLTIWGRYYEKMSGGYRLQNNGTYRKYHYVEKRYLSIPAAETKND